ncbi:hypothetical protein [Lyngbya sp. PCC 8106]|uniref:hypothetical protein n=1 Tax=Lyngbya sp. (strain PCC 8106) TaxID=313612 RepID=UPI0018DCA185|nr:hypothetical protein [Lyngbya sp. PCC 8106]
MSHLQDNLEAVNLKLSSQDIEQLDELTTSSPLYPGWMQPLSFDPVVQKALKSDDSNFLRNLFESYFILSC